MSAEAWLTYIQTAVAHCKNGKGLIRVNGKPLSLVQPEGLRYKVYEPVLILGLDKFGMVLDTQDMIGNRC